MSNYSDVEVRMFASGREYEERNLRDEQSIAESIRSNVLPTFSAAYQTVNVKVVRRADGTPDYLIAYMLRSDTYTADVVKVEVDDGYQVQGIVENYDDADDDEEESDDVIGPGPPEYGVNFVVATPEDTIATAVSAVNDIHNMATAAGYSATKLIGANASLANYRAYLKSGLKVFVNIGHGNTNGIVLHDGFLNHAWFQGISGNPLKPAVVYFNSCQVFNDPLKSKVMQAGARTYVGGIVNLLIGPSEEVCKCFWSKSLTAITPMSKILNQCEIAKYPTQGAHGIIGDTGSFKKSAWYYGKPVLRTHAKNSTQMTWALLGNMGSSGWIRIRPNAPDGTMNIFMILCEALANNHKVDVYIRDGMIEQATLT